VIVGVVLTALLGGLLVPTIKTYLDRRRSRLDLSRDLLERLAASLWMYWKLAMRVAYYGSKGAARRDDLESALKVWEGDDTWANGGQIQVQVSRAKRLLPEETHTDLDRAPSAVVEVLDQQVKDLRDRSNSAEWDAFYTCLIGDKRDQIDGLLLSLNLHLDYWQRIRPGRWWRNLRRKKPGPIKLNKVPCDPDGWP